MQFLMEIPTLQEIPEGSIFIETKKVFLDNRVIIFDVYVKGHEFFKILKKEIVSMQFTLKDAE
ncbi:TPA_asm: hypothetical protein vir519_00034 [Caudoviricetes sp. vir519]|nr:TPA_asm: hypothetical protein vir519_00034 [Caudoviricetes sp. vir519]